MNGTLAVIFLNISTGLGLPPGLLSAICWVESSHRPHVVHKDDGGRDSLGVCQVQYRTAKHVGFVGTEKELLRPGANAGAAGLYLKKQLKRYNGDVKKAVSAYNAGTYTTKNNQYVRKVMAAWAAQK